MQWKNIKKINVSINGRKKNYAKVNELAFYIHNVRIARPWFLFIFIKARYLLLELYIHTKKEK